MKTLSLRSAGSLLTLLVLCSGCATSLPDESPPLADMEEPLALFQEPDDETEREALPLGTFTGCYVGEPRESLEALLGEAEGVEVVRIVENSPAEIAGLAVGDLLLEARIGDGAARRLRHASDWRKVELDAKPDDVVTVSLDRANRRTSTTLTVVPRTRPVPRGEVRRIREETKVGVVMRTATEVEARAAGLGPGGGAVVVGLAKRSPWRAAGIRFGDLLVAVDGREVSDPDVVVEAIRGAADHLTIAIERNGERLEIDAPVSRRAQEMREFSLVPIFDYESDRGKSDTSILLGLFRYQSTAAAWRVRLFWLIRFGGGDADELMEVDT